MCVCVCLVNKRLDEWVDEDVLNIDKVQFPHKESKVSALAKNSRPSSPDTPVPTPVETKKHGSFLGRKRTVIRETLNITMNSTA